MASTNRKTRQDKLPRADWLEIFSSPPASGVGESGLRFGKSLPLGGSSGCWGPRRRWTLRVLTTEARAPAGLERIPGHELVLDKVTFRLLAWTRYQVTDFRYHYDQEKKTIANRRQLATGTLPDAVLASLGPTLGSRDFGASHA